ncbi:MAG: SulP family inorganic anion transporter, partial [Betaproteobacteria bacterium]
MARVLASDAAGTGEPAPSTHWRGEIAGGLAGGVARLIVALTMGLLAFAPLGREFAHLGVRAGLYAVVVGQLAVLLASGRSAGGSAPVAATSLVLAGFIAELASDPAIAPLEGNDPAQIIVLVGMCVALAGTLQIAFALLRADALIRFLPYPFLAGFTCGVAALIAIAQAPALLGITRTEWLAGPSVWLSALHPAALALGLATTAMILWLMPRSGRLPAAALGVAVALAGYALVGALVPGLSFGPRVGSLDFGVAPRVAVAGLFAHADVLASTHLRGLVLTSILIAILGSLQGLLYAVAVDAQTGQRRDLNRELLAQGVGNVASGLAGGVPLMLLPPVALAQWRAGGHTWRAGAIGVALLAVVLLAGGPWIARIPLAILAGAMLTIALGLVDQWTRALFRRLRAPAARQDRLAIWSAVIVVVVALATVFTNFAAALAIGLILSMALFIASLHHTLVRAIVDGHHRPSRRAWGPAELAGVLQARGRTRIVELEGALFFGSADRLCVLAERLARDADWIVLDFARVSTVDATGAFLLDQLEQRLAARGVRLLLAGLATDGRNGAAMLAYGAFGDRSPRPWFPDVDRAVEHVERSALGPADAVTPSEIPARALSLFDGFGGGDLAVVAAALARRALARGALLFQEGDAGDRLYLVA